MTRRRVFVTGMGVVSPCGNSLDPAFDAVCAGQAHAEVLPAVEGRREADAIASPCSIDVDDVIPRLQARMMSRAAQMGLVAATQAIEHAGWVPGVEASESVGVYIGCALGGSEALDAAYSTRTEGRRVRPATVPMSMASGPAAHISLRYGLVGPSQTYSMACVSSAVAIGEAFRAIRDGYLERVIAGGAESQLSRGTVTAWQALGALATGHPAGPAASSRPFDADRTGLVLGEGAAVLILESEASAAAAGRTPLAEVIGYGASSDAHHLTEPHVTGQSRAMRAALADAAVDPGAVGYLNAHATATLAGDRVECAAIREVFGAAAEDLPVSSTKGVHGHLVGAAGALEALWTIQALRTGRMPPNANLDEPGEGCDLGGLLRRETSAPDLRIALSNSFAFGGSNAALVFARV